MTAKSVEEAETPAMDETLEQTDSAVAPEERTSSAEENLSEEKESLLQEKGQASSDEAKPVSDSEPGINIVINGQPTRMTGKKDYIFVDIFNVIDFDIHASAGRPVVTKINGTPCGYSAVLHDGDRVDVYWEEV